MIRRAEERIVAMDCLVELSALEFLDLFYKPWLANLRAFCNLEFDYLAAESVGKLFLCALEVF
jgi:hypothetical protein